jgi:hypothetical protein
MASTITFYDQGWKLITTAGVDLDTIELRIRLVTSGYTFSASHTLWDNGANDATDPSFSELTTTGGYTVGGKQLLTPTVTNSNVDYADVTWTSLTATFRHCICVAVGTYGGLVNPVIFQLLPNSDNTDVVSLGSNWGIVWNSTNGLFYRP